MALCKYKNALGEPGEGVHFHIGGIAVVDVVLTLIGAYLLARYTRVPMWGAIVGLFVLGIVVHAIFCVDTTLNKKLGL